MTLARLAARHGVATAHSPSEGVTVPVPDATVVAVLAALGIDAATPEAVVAALDAAERADRERLLPPTLVHHHGDGPVRPPEGLPPGTRLRVTTEDGAVVTGQDWSELPLGVHTVEAEAPDGRAATGTLIVSPARVPGPGRRAYGLLVQLYSLLSTRSWGMGDLGDLRELVTWAGRTHGAGFVQVNPLHAGVPGAPGDPSPYRPSSRRFPDPVHLRIEEIPEYALLGPERREELDRILAEAAELRERVLGKGALIDRDAVWEVKRRALELVLGAVEPGPGRRAEFHDFLAERGRALEDHATYQALAERHGPHWRSWPEELRTPRGAETAVRDDPALAARVDFHCRLAWLTDRQLAAAAGAAREAGMAVGIVHDLAVGVHPEGSDAWARQEAFAAGMSVGAPPDAFNSRGQDWGLPPWRPDALAATGYAPYRGLLRELLRHAGALRIDHVMGLFRLWWVPEGREPTEGTYVRYDAEAMLAVLVLEAHRAGALVIGEDLGTVEPGVREELARRGCSGPPCSGSSGTGRAPAGRCRRGSGARSAWPRPPPTTCPPRPPGSRASTSPCGTGSGCSPATWSGSARRTRRRPPSGWTCSSGRACFRRGRGTRRPRSGPSTGSCSPPRPGWWAPGCRTRWGTGDRRTCRAPGTSTPTGGCRSRVGTASR